MEFRYMLFRCHSLKSFAKEIIAICCIMSVILVYIRMMTVKILFIGDIVGSPGREMLTDYLPKLKEKYRPQITVVNGENAAAGKGITEKIYKQFLNLGVQAVTMGNHTWNKREVIDFIDEAPYLIRPANFPENNPGKGIVYEIGRAHV